ncbi:MAG: ATP synthase F1 subunit epsilon, partial [Anaerolineaceae bacterium]|nr:ATP synthase F1 subunit epsilon [Anaerolineaceae bacterium]
VFSGDVDIVILPGTAGQMGVLPHHTPLLTTLQYGIITVRVGKEEQHFTVAGGFAEIQPDQVTVLATASENILEIDVDRAEQARKRADESLKNVAKLPKEQILAEQAALKRSDLRINAVRKYRPAKHYPSSHR